MSDTAYPPSINDVSAKLGSTTVALQLVTQELVSLQQQAAGGGTAAPGSPGATPVISIGAVSTGATAAASITGSAATPVLNLVIPPGTPGAPGATPAISIGQVSSGATAAVSISGSAAAPVLNLVLPQGTPGTPGATPAIAIGTVSSGTTAAASISGSASAPALNLVLPQGVPGTPGQTPALSIGTVSSGASAAATLTGSAAAPVLSLTLVKGDPGTLGDGEVSGNTVARTGGALITNTARTNRTYHIDDFPGAQNNVSGSMSVFDDAAATAMWAQILADAAKCTNVPAGFTASIVLGAHQYNWRNQVNFIVPSNGSTSNPQSSLPVELHMIVEWNSSVHYTFGSAGFCFSPYTMLGRYDDLFSRKQFNNRYQGVSAYAIKKTATAGTNAAASMALGSFNETAGGGVSNFRFGQFDCYDANTGGHYLSWLDVSGVFFAQIDGPAGSSNPGGTVSATSGVNYPGVSAIRLGGFNIQVWLKNLLPNYVECGLRVVGYVEAMLTQNLGGVNCDYNVWTDVQGTDWTAFYPNSYGFGLQWTFDDQSEMDSFRWNYDISTVNIILMYGGTIYQHAAGGGLACDGQITGDTANTGGIILRGCSEIKVHDVHFRGPAVSPGQVGDGSGAYCANGGRGLWITSSTFNGLQNKPNGPPNGAYARSTHGTFDGNDFMGWGASGTVSPILFDSDCIALTSSMSRFFFAPSNVHDGYAARYPVEDRYGYNQGFDFVGTADGSFNTTLRSLR
jgi:hypothetical protein